MPGKGTGTKRGSGREERAPRTDLPPKKEPYYEGYFGTEEEEGVVREEDDADAARKEQDREP